ncbi:M23 family metallopeptidase [Jannaschia sp. M317]|uniref:M23 family metallopeptidase n=1 Tax=Jannaschia sp. M317 TaxID=2867011 RepID=UPI0021A2A1AD|nr:M23 family metallopeptidase [Jannaschia sp. M317]UWQ18774.1 M23 family metallopeptidase [Jannaschia sp. M317]
MRLLSLFCLFLSVGPGWAAPPVLRVPIDCTFGVSCFIQQYVDADPGPGARDYTGGPLSYDGHKGTDFRLPDQEAMDAGVPVRAPATGRVLGLRNDMPDQLVTDAATVSGRECGNGVVLDHGDGWQTQLCHLAEGSVLPRVGEIIEAGQIVGRIGLSGLTQFPHVHLSVRRHGVVVDPFVDRLWAEPPAYEPGGFLSIGVSDDVPQFTEVKAGTADAPSLAADAPALVVWAAMFGGRVGDVIALRITGPNGRDVLQHDATLDRTQAELFRAAGRRLTGARWRGGVYTGTATLFRDGQMLDRIETRISIR